MKFKQMGMRTMFVWVSLIAGIIIGSISFTGVFANDDTLQGPLPEIKYPTNENGQTYGSAAEARTPEEEPDLISAIGLDGTKGYVKKKDLHGPTPANPEEALAMMEKSENNRKIPLYDVDGKTVIGQFNIGKGRVNER